MKKLLIATLLFITLGAVLISRRNTADNDRYVEWMKKSEQQRIEVINNTPQLW